MLKNGTHRLEVWAASLYDLAKRKRLYLGIILFLDEEKFRYSFMKKPLNSAENFDSCIIEGLRLLSSQKHFKAG